jgi:CRISPR-associated endonuclease/helicase Cas3
VLAKSALRRRDEQLAALLTSGLPRGFRHEFASLDFETINNPLVRHLVATHHGYGRPWLMPCKDEAAAGAHYADLDQHWTRAWAATSLRYGPWTLANMEWLLRAADARASIEETTMEESSDEAR